MAKAARKAAWLLAAMTIVPAARVHAAQDDPLTRRVRTPNPQIAAMIERAAESSATFRAMVDQINTSDSIVFVADGHCQNHQAACFTATQMAGSQRMLFVTVDLSKHHHDCDTMASIGHELRHTLEVIADPSVTTPALQYFFYRSKGFHANAGGFETQAAMEAGTEVRDEVQHFMKARGL